jgi:uncharacterized protein (TIGR02284 family)
MSSEKTKELKKLLERLVDSSDGFKKAAEHANQIRHVTLFTDLSNERYQSALVIQEHLERMDEKIDLDGSFLANIHRMYMDVKEKFDNDGDDEALLECIITGESDLMGCYRDAIEGASYDPELLEKLQTQYKNVSATMDIIQAKEEAA